MVIEAATGTTAATVVAGNRRSRSTAYRDVIVSSTIASSFDRSLYHRHRALLRPTTRVAFASLDEQHAREVGGTRQTSPLRAFLLPFDGDLVDMRRVLLASCSNRFVSR